MLTLKTKIVGIQELRRDLQAFDKRSKKALEIAIKVEAFRQLRELRAAMRKGAPSGMPYAKELSEIARRTKTGRLKKNQIPLYRLARLLRYNIKFRGGDIQMSFGFVSSKNRPLSGSWKKLVRKHAEGTDVLYSGSRTELGRRLARIGGKMKKRGDADAKFFFLRKTTGRRIDLPSRPVIEPFWRRREPEARRNIRRNFRRKMRGERI